MIQTIKILFIQPISKRLLGIIFILVGVLAIVGSIVIDLLGGGQPAGETGEQAPKASPTETLLKGLFGKQGGSKNETEQ